MTALGEIKTFPIEAPVIPSGSIYHFTTDNNIRYEVRFGRKQDNFLNATIVFGVLNEEFEGEEYVVTNSGEVYSVMATIVEIVRMYISQHPNINSYEFCGEPSKQHEPDGEPTVRTKLYIRYIDKIFGPGWNTHVVGNKVIVNRQKK